MRINEGEGVAERIGTGMPHSSLPVDAFCVAADHVVALTDAIPPDMWDGVALGEWTVRSLVGHIGRAMSTVVDCLARPATEQTVRSTIDYYILVAERIDAEAVRMRGDQAGAALGDRPAPVLREMRDRAVRSLTQTDDRLVTTAVGGMLWSDYLPTRTFELAVHGLDLARATGQPPLLPPEVLREVVPLATDLVLQRGHAETVLFALTGRCALPAGFSVL
jgi:uncharacterized protein (TIGR03083 family)